MSLFGGGESGAGALRARLAESEILLAPGCYDAFSARLVEQAGFEATFLGGFSSSASRLGLPDTGLLSYGESVSHGRDVCAAVSIPVLGDADTGYGNAANVQRSVLGYARAGFASLMIEDQVWPKRCGHLAGKQTVDRSEALGRIRAAVEARDRAEVDILILARTDAAATDGMDEALRRVEAFVNLGADLTFVEAPRSEEDMRRYCESIPGPKLANLVEDGRTPWLSAAELEEIGYSLVAYPVSLLLAGAHSMQESLEALRAGDQTERRVSFEELQRIVGFDEYRKLEERFEDEE